MLKENASEYQVFCPFCDDAYRKPNPRHGHLYISKEKPVFFCHRCNAKGHIIKLLEYLEFPAIDKIKKLYSFNGLTSKYSNNKRALKFNDFRDKEQQLIIDIEKLKSFSFDINNSIVLNYIKRRTGVNNIQLLQLLNIIPISNKINKQPAILFLSNHIYNSKHIIPYQIRLIHQKKYIKLVKNTNHKYFHLIDPAIIHNNNKAGNRLLRTEQIILSEGIFDTVNIYLHIYKITDDIKKLFITITGAYYQTMIIKLIEYFPLLKQIDIYLDADINVNRLIKMIKYSIKYNNIRNNITINFYKNLFAKDFGDISSSNPLTPVLINTMEVINK